MRRLVPSLVLAVALLWVGRARADDGGTVALLPLDAEAKLELYGQPVASEIARALVAGAVDVVVVGPQMAVPDRARLIVDGTIRAKGDAVVLALRVRDPRDGTVLEQLAATAATLTTIDRAAAELSGRLLPIVRTRLAALAPTPSAPRPAPAVDTPRAAAPAAAASKPLLVAVGVGRDARAAVEPLRVALAAAAPAWARRHDRAPRAIEPGRLGKPTAAQTVAASDADRAILFEVLAYRVTTPGLPGIEAAGGRVSTATARVRVRIAGASGIVFDRVVVTDSVVGDRGLAPAALADRVAREVLAIVRPHARRAVPGWP